MEFHAKNAATCARTYVRVRELVDAGLTTGTSHVYDE